MLPRGQASIRALAAVARQHRVCPVAVAGAVPRFVRLQPQSSSVTLSRLGLGPGLLHARFNSTTKDGSNDTPNVQPPIQPAPASAGSDAQAASAPAKKHKHHWSYSRHGELDPDFSSRHPWIASVLRLVISSIVGVVVVGGILLIHDAGTYNERHVGRVPVNPLSLHPRRGGPKNLPIIEVNIDDEEDEEKRAMKDKPRLVILGCGWGVSAAS